MGDILSDFFLHGLRYEEIAKSRGVAVALGGCLLEARVESNAADLGAGGK